MAERAALKDYKILHKFTILHAGWEMDYEAWIARNKQGEMVYLSTSHGSLWDHGRDVSELHSKLAETRESVTGIKKAIALMGGKV